MIYENVIHGTYQQGKFIYRYPKWMTRWMNGLDDLNYPTEKFDVYNPLGIELVEGTEYNGRAITFEDGDIIEIIGVYVAPPEGEKEIPDPLFGWGDYCDI